MMLSEVLSWVQRSHVECEALPAGPKRWEHVIIFQPNNVCANPSDKANAILLSNIQRTFGL